MGDLEWTNDLVIRLIQEYRNRPELWDVTHEMYRVQTLKYETWSELANMFECDIADLRKKLNSLFASHRREKAKVRSGGRTNWFLYSYLSFLPTHVKDTHPGTDHSQPTAKRQPKRSIKQRAPSSDENDDADDDNQMVQEILIKEEPVVQTYTKAVRNTQTHKPRLTRPIKRRIIRENSSDHLDSRLSEALKLLRRSDLARRKDSCDSFGEYIADSLRKHDERTQSMIKQAINNILFEQEMKKYSAANQQYAVVISGIDENPLILDEAEK